MSLKLALAASAFLVAAPVVAQDAAPPAPVTATEPTVPALSEAEIEAKGEAFGTSMKPWSRNWRR